MSCGRVLQLMLKLKLQFFGHLMRRADSLEKTLMLPPVPKEPSSYDFAPLHLGPFSPPDRDRRVDSPVLS